MNETGSRFGGAAIVGRWGIAAVAVLLAGIGPLLARPEAVGWWLLPATLLGLLLAAVWAVGKEALGKAVWNWVAGAFRAAKATS